MEKKYIPMNEATRKLSLALREIADNLDREITQITGEKLGFTLMVFTDGRAQYVSNVDRAVSVAQIEKMMAYWKANLPDIKAHEIN